MSINEIDDNDPYAAVQYAVKQICEEQDRIVGNYQTSSRAIATISELLFQYATNFLAKDLNSFAQHGGRKTTISENDVKLTIRRNTGLEVRIECLLHESSVGRKTKTTTSIVNYRNKSKKQLNRFPEQKPKKSFLRDHDSDTEGENSSEDHDTTFHFACQTDAKSKRAPANDINNMGTHNEIDYKCSLDYNLTYTDSDSESNGSHKKLTVVMSKSNTSNFKLPRQEIDSDTDLDASIHENSKRMRFDDVNALDFSHSS
jgi:histone H3/H4